jgi:hypothetical protein
LDFRMLFLSIAGWLLSLRDFIEPAN